jgi:hypothetical protein
MPRYNFTTDNGSGPDTTDGPIDLPDDHAAAEQAQRALADMADDALPNGSRKDLTAHVDGASGERIYEASLKFRGKTARDIKAEHTQRDADADEATEAIVRALNGIEPPRS